SHLAHLAQTFLLKLGIAHRQNLVDDKDLWLKMRGYGKSQPNRHSRRISLDGGIEKFLHLGECDDLIEFPFDLRARHPKDSPIEIDILAAGKLGVEAGANFQEARDAPLNRDASFARLR